MTLKEIMGDGVAIILYHGDEVIISWNQARTLQAWGQVEPGRYSLLSVRSLEEIPLSVENAILRAAFFYMNR